MKKRLKLITRVLVFIAALGMIVVLFTPIWRIELNAPQYPEGLMLLIHANGLRGNVDIVNGLNHYIGMKTLHNEDFVEFKILPYCIVFFALLFALTAALGRRRLLNLSLILFVAFGILAMYDFWKWEYDYGHNLNPNAAIVVPGMAYQPPLIGFKQLLNFGAYSIPDTGGWIFIAAGVLVLCGVIIEWRKSKVPSLKAASAMLVLTIGLNSCKQEVVPIKLGVDNCSNCKMTISDPKFGGEILTKKGKAYKFDDIACLKEFLTQGPADELQGSQVYLVDYAGNHSLIPATDASLLRGDDIHGPMGGNVIAFSVKDSAAAMAGQFRASTLGWNDLKK